ncbi:putative selenium-binding protein, partial [Danaus plexippus plexippus]|jgi:hypothetical protein
MAC